MIFGEKARLGAAVLAFGSFSALAGVTHAADVKRTPTPAVEEAPGVPGEDIFGFTSPTDLGKAGDHGVALENDFRIGKRDGTYGVLTQKLEYSRTITDNFAAAISLFGAYHNMKNVTVQPVDRTGYNFDGVSAEFAYKLVERSLSNPFGVTIRLEPRWSRIDGPSGIHAQGFSAEAKLLIDAVLIPDKLYWAANFNWAPGVQEVVGMKDQMARSSTTNISTALTYAFSDKVMVGVEAKYVTSFGDYFFKNKQGDALFFGPTLFWKITDKIAFNAVYLPQLSGRAAATPGLRLDLDNFERSIFRAKLAVAF